MIFDGPPKRWPTSYGYVHIEGPDRIWLFGPIEVDYDRHFGPSFWIGAHNCNPGRCSPWWLLWRVLRKRLTTTGREET